MVGEVDRPDIIFAYANVFGKEDENKNFVAFPQNMITNPDKMFETIVEAATPKSGQIGKALKIEKRILNWVSLVDILDECPRLLSIMCHGKHDCKSGLSEFAFENNEKPYLSDNFDEVRLLECLQSRKRSYKIDVIVLSTCHSERLGKILLKCIHPTPAIIAINSQDQVLEWSTIHFNHRFIKSLIDGLSI